jgi:hypothetical protein
MGPWAFEPESLRSYLRKAGSVSVLESKPRHDHSLHRVYLIPHRWQLDIARILVSVKHFTFGCVHLTDINE